MKFASWPDARCPHSLLLAVVFLLAFPLGSARAGDDVADRIQRITQIMQGLQAGPPKIETSGPSGQLDSGKLVAGAPPLGPGVDRTGLVVWIYAHSSLSWARARFDARAKEVLCQQDSQANDPCAKDAGAPAAEYSEDGDAVAQQLRKGEAKKLRDGSKAVVAVTAESPDPVLLLVTGKYPFPAAIGYAAGTCGDAYVQVAKRKVSEKTIEDFAKAVGRDRYEAEYKGWVRQQNPALQSEALQSLETLIGRLAAAGVCEGGPAGGPELVFPDSFPTMVIQAVADPGGRINVPFVAGKTGVVVVRPVVRERKTPLEGVRISVRAVTQTGEASSLSPLGRNTIQAFPEEEGPHEWGYFILAPDKAVEGSLTLEVEAAAPGGSGVKDAKQTLQLTFERGPSLFVQYVPVCYLENTRCPGPGIAGAQELMSKIYPVADRGGIRYEALPTKFSYDPWPRSWRLEGTSDPRTAESFLRLFKVKLQKFYDTIIGEKPDQLFAWLPAIPGLKTRGDSDPVYVGGQGRVGWGQDTSQVPNPGREDFDWQHILAHEIGHNLGLRHTGTRDEYSLPIALGPTPAPCFFGEAHARPPGETRPLRPQETDWPYPNGTINGEAFDPRDPQAKEVKPGESTYDVMTYCSPPRSRIWISPHHYKKLFDSGLRPGAGAKAPRGRTMTALAAPEPALGWPWGPWQPVPVYAAGPSEFLILSGMASSDGQRVQLDPAYRVPDTGTGTPHNPSGNYCVRLTGGIREEQVCFVLTFLDHQMHAVPEQGFSVKVPFPPGTSRASLLRDGRELAAVTSGVPAPSVTIQGLGAGQTLRGRSTITWAGGNPDRSGVTYVVLYTPNGGGTWYPLAIDATDPRLSFDTADLASSDRAMFRVLSSRGLSTAVAETGPVKIVGRAVRAGQVRVPSTAPARYVTLAQTLLWAGTAVWLILRRRGTAPRA